MRLAAFALLLLLGAFSAALTLPPGTSGDFVSLVASGEAARQGLDPHAVYPATSSSETVQGRIYGPNINLPPTVLLYQLLPTLDIPSAANLWRLLTIAMFAASVALIWRAQPAGITPLRLAWLFGGPFLWVTLASAQVYGLLILMTVAAWLLLDKGRPLSAGVLIGLLCCIKPQFALWPMLLLLSGHRRAAIASLLTAALILPIPAIVYGPAVYLQWWDAANRYSPMWIITNMGIVAPLSRAGVPWLLPIVGAALVASAWRWSTREGRSASEVSTAALALSLVLSPIAWTPYLLLLLPALLSPRPWSGATAIGAALLAIPGSVLGLGYGVLPVGMVYPVGLLLLTGGLLHMDGYQLTTSRNANQASNGTATPSR